MEAVEQRVFSPCARHGFRFCLGQSCNPNDCSRCCIFQPSNVSRHPSSLPYPSSLSAPPPPPPPPSPPRGALKHWKTRVVGELQQGPPAGAAAGCRCRRRCRRRAPPPPKSQEDAAGAAAENEEIATAATPPVPLVPQGVDIEGGAEVGTSIPPGPGDAAGADGVPADVAVGAMPLNACGTQNTTYDSTWTKYRSRCTTTVSAVCLPAGRCCCNILPQVLKTTFAKKVAPVKANNDNDKCLRIRC